HARRQGAAPAAAPGRQRPRRAPPPDGRDAAQARRARQIGPPKRGTVPLFPTDPQALRKEGLSLFCRELVPRLCAPRKARGAAQSPCKVAPCPPSATP